MFNYFSALIFGLVQGATEFLPVSSSGHLVILHQFFPHLVANDLAFDTILHLATLLAVLWYFRTEVINLIISWLKSLVGKRDADSKLAWLIILGIIPAGVMGWLFSNSIEAYFRSPIWVAAMLIIVGIAFIVFEKRYGQNQEILSQLNWKNALTIGVAQVLALIPGTSRSGITIIAGMGTGLKREEAVKFSFLLSMPLIAAAALSQAKTLLHVSFSIDEKIIYTIAFLAALVSGYLAVKYFIKYAANHTLNIFAYYRFVLAGTILILWLLFK
jgi:undecaprenyl-diphosphatase